MGRYVAHQGVVKLKESELYRYLTQVELEEIESIHESFILEKGDGFNNTELLSNKQNKELQTKIKPYIKLASARKNKPDIRKYQSFVYRAFSSFWDKIYNLSLALVLVTLVIYLSMFFR